MSFLLFHKDNYFLYISILVQTKGRQLWEIREDIFQFYYLLGIDRYVNPFPHTIPLITDWKWSLNRTNLPSVAKESTWRDAASEVKDCAWFSFPALLYISLPLHKRAFLFYPGSDSIVIMRSLFPGKLSAFRPDLWVLNVLLSRFWQLFLDLANHSQWKPRNNCSITLSIVTDSFCKYILGVRLWTFVLHQKKKSKSIYMEVISF